MAREGVGREKRAVGVRKGGVEGVYRMQGRRKGINAVWTPTYLHVEYTV